MKHLLVILAIPFVVGAAGAAPDLTDRPVKVDGQTFPLSKVLKAYWDCDYVATTTGMSLDEGAMCVVISETIKKELFGGDFKSMHAWWLSSKQTEYDARRGLGQKAPK